MVIGGEEEGEKKKEGERRWGWGVVLVEKKKVRRRRRKKERKWGKKDETVGATRTSSTEWRAAFWRFGRRSAHCNRSDRSHPLRLIGRKRQEKTIGN